MAGFFTQFAQEIQTDVQVGIELLFIGVHLLGEKVQPCVEVQNIGAFKVAFFGDGVDFLQLFQFRLIKGVELVL